MQVALISLNHIVPKSDVDEQAAAMQLIRTCMNGGCVGRWTTNRTLESSPSKGQLGNDESEAASHRRRRVTDSVGLIEA